MPRNILLCVVLLVYPLSFTAVFSEEFGTAKAPDLLFTDPAAALPVLEQLSKSAPSAELEVYVAYAQFKIDEESPKSAAKLRRSIRKYIKSSEPAYREIGLILTQFARYELERGDTDDGREVATRAEEILRATAPEEIDAIARAVIWKGVADIIDQPATRFSISKSYEEFERARALYAGAVEDADMNLMLAESIAWQAAAAGKMATYFSVKKDAEPLGAVFALRGGLDCSNAWTANPYHSIRIKSSWARNLIEHGVPYGLIIVMDAGPEGIPENARLIAEARRPSLLLDKRESERHREEVILRSLTRWRADMVHAPAGCLKNQVLVLGGYMPAEYNRFELGVQTNVGNYQQP